LLLLLAACGPKPADTDTGFPLDVFEEDAEEASVAWLEEGILLTVPDGREPVAFGIAETRGDCGWASCWTGEDCLNGYNYDDHELKYCHPVQPGRTLLSYGGNISDLAVGEETAFVGPNFATVVTYYLRYADETCEVWGPDVAYFAELNCILR